MMALPHVEVPAEVQGHSSPPAAEVVAGRYSCFKAHVTIPPAQNFSLPIVITADQCPSAITWNFNVDGGRDIQFSVRQGHEMEADSPRADPVALSSVVQAITAEDDHHVTEAQPSTADSDLVSATAAEVPHAPEVPTHNEIVPSTKCSSSSGCPPHLLVDVEGTYVLVFSNEHSWVREKHLSYTVTVDRNDSAIEEACAAATLELFIVAGRPPSPWGSDCDGKADSDVKACVDAGAQVCQFTTSYGFPLYAAAQQGNAAVASSLLRCGAAVNQQTASGATALLIAAGQGSIDVVQTLLDAGADPNAVSVDGCTPLLLATQYGHVMVAQLLFASGADVHFQTPRVETLLTLSAGWGHLAMTKFLIKAGIDVNARTKTDGPTALTTAISYSCVETVRILLAASALPNLCLNNGASPLYLAVAEKNASLVSMLLDAGASADLSVSGGASPLLVASADGKVDIVSLLIDSGASLDLGTKVGLTPLHMACMNNMYDVVCVLIDSGADPLVTDVEGRQPYDVSNLQDIRDKLQSSSKCTVM